MQQYSDVVQQFLAAFDGERWNDDVAASFQSANQFSLDRLASFLQRIVVAIAIAVSAFANDVVVASGRVRFRVKRLFFWAQVTGEQQREFFARLFVVHTNLGRCTTQQVSGVPKSNFHTWFWFEPSLVLGPFDQFDCFFGVGDRIDRLDRLFAFSQALAVPPFGVGFLDPSGI